MTEQAELRPGIASKRWPGAIHELLATGHLPADTPGLAALETDLPPDWHVLVQKDGLFDQQGWPLRHDAELAYRACILEPLNDTIARAHLSVVRAWLDGKTTNEALGAAWRASAAVRIGAAFAASPPSDAACLEVYEKMCPDATEADRAMFLEARRHPPAVTTAWLAVESAFLAREGWLSYYAYRGILPQPPVHAATALRAAVEARLVSWTEVVDWARELARSGSSGKTHEH